MRDYLYYVVLLVNREGKELAIVDNTYHKHV